MAVFADPEGAVFCVWQAKEHRGARIVNEHGSVNFNDLNTRDEGAKAFYGAVFGWETLELGGGSGGRCPATATISSATTPASARGWPRWAPEGFEDVVASWSRSRTTSPTRPRTGA